MGIVLKSCLLHISWDFLKRQKQCVLSDGMMAVIEQSPRRRVPDICVEAAISGSVGEGVQSCLSHLTGLLLSIF